MKFNEKLVLNSYLLSLFGVDSQETKDTDKCYNGLEKLANGLKDYKLEEIDDEGISLFYHTIVSNVSLTRNISNDKLLEYDGNIVRHTNTMGRGIKWKYFQYLSLLFVEIYLDKYFDNKDGLLNELNAHLKKLNSKIEDKKEKLTEYRKGELNKLALYNATGSGKTLLLHINLFQFNYYKHKHSININKTILITPNEGLSNQHLEEFKESNIETSIFVKDKSSSSGHTQGSATYSDIEIIEITKLAEENGDKTVAVDSFENNNLVFIDEGHRGAKGDIWKANRDKLSSSGFAFEYSATFVQAINSSTGTKKKNLENEYAKAIIFDYSYKYFYNDGYGKDYSILNLRDDSDSVKHTYLTASLLSFYQQMKIYESEKALLKPYLIEKPLMVFVGASVNAVRNENNKQVSDVINVLLFIDEFIKNKNESIANINKIMKLDSGLNRKDGSDLFANKFDFLEGTNLNATQYYDDILSIIFNATNGVLHLENLKGIDGEIALKIGENEHFGVINVGDSAKLIKICESNGIAISSRDFLSSLFKTINHTTSNLNILIGSKKFSEGWSSWRVSAMGLMNMGKKEGSSIIQLFGRGVRLKGYNFCLKRSGAIYDKELDEKYQAIETLNIFGLKADYMTSFQKYLEDECVPTGGRVNIEIPVTYNVDEKTYKTLNVISLKEGKDFKKEVNLHFKYSDVYSINQKIILSLYKEVDILESRKSNGDRLDLLPEKLKKEHLSFVNIDNIFFELQQFKNEKNWSNLNIDKFNIIELISKEDWYKLYIPSADMEMASFKSISKFEEIIITLLKKYMRSLYEYEKSKWENEFLEYRTLSKKRDRANLIDKYIISVDEGKKDVIERLKKDISELLAENKKDLIFFNANQHLYNPLIYKNKGMKGLSIKPVELNSGEKEFVDILSSYLFSSRKNEDIYLLRNQSKIGLSLFAEGNFYPDFIMWILKDEKQYISFIDPKGIRNIDPLYNSKINLTEEIKKIEKSLKNEKIILNSFIISNTPFRDIQNLHGKLDKKALENKNVLFQEDDYMQIMFNKILEDK